MYNESVPDWTWSVVKGHARYPARYRNCNNINSNSSRAMATDRILESLREICDAVDACPF